LRVATRALAQRKRLVAAAGGARRRAARTGPQSPEPEKVVSLHGSEVNEDS
jgi:hypothetical protein